MIRGIWTSKMFATALLTGSSLLAIVAPASWAETIQLPAQADIQKAIDHAQPGDVLQLSLGIYQGPIVIDKPRSLIGPEVDARDRKSVVQGRSGDLGCVVSVYGDHLSR